MSTNTLKRLPLAALAGAALLGLAACSEVPQVTVYEQGDFYSHISNPQNGSTPKAQAERNWYVISEQAGLSPVSIER